ncbi:nucleotidyltransferase domain-containing protein [Cellulomonas palmilytica]|uniref:nucleotidyltransferase domain-containing protein n=1 Tax=Cellulomonas palmilytica TaxID=2608402 RepID=UPI0037BFCED6
MTRVDERQRRARRAVRAVRVRRAGAFGSVARGEDRADSDIDVLTTCFPAGTSPARSSTLSRRCHRSSGARWTSCPAGQCTHCCANTAGDRLGARRRPTRLNYEAPYRPAIELSLCTT